MPLRGEVNVGRATGNRLHLDDPAVSRSHARVLEAPAGIEVEDLGSYSGTFLDGHRVRGRTAVRDGQRLRIGDTQLRVERQRDDCEPARTIVVPRGATVRVDGTGVTPARVESPAATPQRPRLRSGWKLKRLGADEDPHRFVLADLAGPGFMRLGENEARWLARLDGRHTVAELAAEAERSGGVEAIRGLATLLAELGDRGLLVGGVAAAQPPSAPGRLRRLLRTRQPLTVDVAERIERVYLHWGFSLFTVPGLLTMSITIALGLCAFVALVAGGDVRPLRVDERLGLGAAAFVAGRFALVAVHELGHSLTLASLGRRVRSAGLKVVLVFPYAFVDTSEAWFEPRRRRMAVGAAGPVADLLVAGTFSLTALATVGAVQDIAFQLSLGGYLAALANLNPLIERDGYHLLVDALGEPDLRRRAREQLRRRLAGHRAARDEPRSVLVYGIVALGWGLLAAGVVGAMTYVYASRIAGPVPELSWSLAAIALALALLPTAAVLAVPLRDRRAQPPGASAR
jgi:putative peptide zinc metalloprotease protein